MDHHAAAVLALLLLAGAAQAAEPPVGDPAPADPASLVAALAGPDLADPSVAAEAVAGQLPPQAAAPLRRAMALHAEADLLADRLGEAAGISDALARAAEQAGFRLPAAAEPVRFAGFVEAVPALAATAGVALAPADLAAAGDLDRLFPQELARPILDLAGAMVAAAAMREEAVAALTAEDRRALAEQVAGLQAGGAADVEALADVAGRLDLARLVSAAALVSRAAEDAASRIQASVDLWPEPANGPAAPGWPPPPVPIGSSPMAPYIGPPCDLPYTWPLLVAIPSVLAVGSFAPNTFSDDVVLSIDPGPGGPPGDCYTNNAGATNAAVPYPNPGGVHFPVAVAIDLAGDDVYHSSNDPVSDGAVCASGASAGDVGYAFQFLQGAAFAGVGLMADLEGEDRYNSDNRLHNCDDPRGPGDDVDYTVRFAQGAGALGVGVLLDAGTPDSDARDAYNSRNSLWADQMDVWPSGLGNARYLVDHAQGAGAFQGIGVMVETNEDVLYNSLNSLLATPNPSTVTFAAQSSASFDVHCSQGIVGACKAFPGELCFDLADSDLIDFPDVCVALARLRSLTDGNVLGVLVDLLGNDKYNCGNSVVGTFDIPTGIPASFTAWVVQGVAAGTATPLVLPGLGPIQLPPAVKLGRPEADLGVGVHADLEGNDCYNSSNFLQGYGAAFDVRLAQGTGQGVAAAGVLADRARDDRYNCANSLHAAKGTSIALRYVQGHGAGDLAAGVHVDATTPQGQSADCYNSFNTQSSGEANDLAIHFSLGTSGGALQVLLPPQAFAVPPIDVPTAVGVLVDTDSPYQDPMPSRDFFNSYNSATGFGGAVGGLEIWVSQGAVAPLPIPGTPVLQGGAGIMVEVGGANTYNYENTAYGLGGCGGLCQLDVALGSVTSAADVGVFVDLSLQPCSIFEATAALFGISPAPTCFDAIGPDRYGGPLSATPVAYPPGLDTVGCHGGAAGGLAVALDLYDGWGAWPFPLVGPPLPTNVLPPPFAFPDPAPWPGFWLLAPPEGLLCLDE